MLTWPTDAREPGDTVAMRDVRGGVVRAVSTAVVVEHTSERLVTWIPLGSPLLLPADAAGHVVKTERVEQLVEVPWNSWGGPVFIWPHGAWHSVRVSWTDAGPDRSLDHWYINLHTPLCPSPYGFDLEDLILDAIVRPDRQSWTWKDEAEFEQARAAGVIARESADIIRDAGARVAADALAGAEPFTRQWEGWRPDPSWQVPVLPAGCTNV